MDLEDQIHNASCEELPVWGLLQKQREEGQDGRRAGTVTAIQKD